MPDARAREEILSLILEETSHELSGPELHAIAQVLKSSNYDLSLPSVQLTGIYVTNLSKIGLLQLASSFDFFVII